MTFWATGTYILDDELFTEYGGVTGTSTALQRNTAYMIAEEQAMRYIQTFLVPTIVTGTYMWPRDGRFQLPYKYVTNVYSVFSVHESGCDCATEEYSGCAFLLDSTNGVVSLRDCGHLTSAYRGCGCSYGSGGLIRFRIAFEAGHPDLQNAPSARLALVKAAEAALNQMINPSRALGGPGDPGLSSYSDSGYSQSMTGLKETPFGGSPEANYIARLLKPFRHYGVMKFR